MSRESELAQKRMVIVKLNKNGKWHMTGDNYGETWCGIQVGQSLGEMMMSGVRTEFMALGRFQSYSLACKKCKIDHIPS